MWGHGLKRVFGPEFSVSLRNSKQETENCRSLPGRLKPSGGLLISVLRRAKAAGKSPKETLSIGQNEALI